MDWWDGEEKTLNAERRSKLRVISYLLTVIERESRVQRSGIVFKFFQNVKADFIAAREIVIEFVFRLCENESFLGRLRAPPDGFNNPPDTRPAR